MMDAPRPTTSDEIGAGLLFQEFRRYDIEIHLRATCYRQFTRHVTRLLNTWNVLLTAERIFHLPNNAQFITTL